MASPPYGIEMGIAFCKKTAVSQPYGLHAQDRARHWRFDANSKKRCGVGNWQEATGPGSGLGLPTLRPIDPLPLVRNQIYCHAALTSYESIRSDRQREQMKCLP